MLYVVFEVTMNMGEYGNQRSQQPQNVNFEPIIRGLRMIFLCGAKCKIRFIHVFERGGEGGSDAQLQMS